VLSTFPVVDVVAEDARVARNADGYYDLKPTEKAGNPFEKVRRAGGPAREEARLPRVTCAGVDAPAPRSSSWRATR